MGKTLKKLLMAGTMALLETVYNTGTFNGYSAEKSYNIEESKKNYEVYEASRLEEIAKKEDKEKFAQPFYLTEDSLNVCIKQAYAKVGKWPKEIDKRLFRLVIRQESRRNAHARSQTGYLGLGQIGKSAYQTFNPEKWKELNTSEGFDTLAFEKELFNPVTNLGVSLQYFDYLSKFCKKKCPSWDTMSLENKRKIILACYNAGHGKVKEAGWDLNSKKLKKENREYSEKIMEAYHDPKVKVKL
jgi:hypothetical protein